MDSSAEALFFPSNCGFKKSGLRGGTTAPSWGGAFTDLQELGQQIHSFAAQPAEKTRPLQDARRPQSTVRHPPTPAAPQRHGGGVAAGGTALPGRVVPQPVGSVLGVVVGHKLLVRADPGPAVLRGCSWAHRGRSEDAVRTPAGVGGGEGGGTVVLPSSLKIK